MNITMLLPLYFLLGLTAGDLFSRTFQFVAVVVISFIGLVLLASFLRYQFMMHDFSRAAPEDIDPEDRFKMTILEKVGTIHRIPEPFAVLMFSIVDEGYFLSDETPELKKQLYADVQKKLQAHMRAYDLVCPFEDRLFGAILTVPRSKALEIAQRIVEGVATTPYRNQLGQLVYIRLRAGVSTFPANGSRVGQLVEEAENALKRAGEQSVPCEMTAADEDEITDEKIQKEEALSSAQRKILDPVSGVLKSDRLQNALQRYVSQYRKAGQPASIMLIDIDQLDRYNKHYGREGGDAVLGGLGRILERQVREEDLIGRFDEDTFLVAMNAKPQDAFASALRMVQEIKQSMIEYEDARLKLTVGIGVAGHPDHGSLPTELIDVASIALEYGKQKGKGQCVLFDRTKMLPAKDDGPFDSF